MALCRRTIADVLRTRVMGRPACRERDSVARRTFLIRGDGFVSWGRGDFEMELVAQIALEVSQRMGSIVGGGAEICREVGNRTGPGANGVEQLRAMFYVG